LMSLAAPRFALGGKSSGKVQTGTPSESVICEISAICG
jgi:hypothetical protein